MGLEGVFGVEEAAAVVDRAGGVKPPTVVKEGEVVRLFLRLFFGNRGEQESAAVVGFAVVRVGFQLDGFSHGVLETREGVRDSRFLDVAIRGGQGVDDVEVDVVGGPVVGVVNDSVHYFGSRIGCLIPEKKKIRSELWDFGHPRI